MTAMPLPRRSENIEPAIPSQSLALDGKLDTTNLKVTTWRVIASEFVKFFSLRSTTWLLAATAVVVVALGALASSASSSIEMPVGGIAMDTPSSRPTLTPARVSMVGV